jgi:hypothetical protein
MQLHISPIRRTPNQLLEPTRLRRVAVLSKFDFMEQFFMFATLAPPAVADLCDS